MNMCLSLTFEPLALAEKSKERRSEVASTGKLEDGLKEDRCRLHFGC